MISFIAYSNEIYEEIKSITFDYENNLKFNTKDERKIWQKIEIFKKITLNNFLVFKEINEILFLDSNDSLTNDLAIDILLLQRVLVYSINFSCQEAISPSDLDEILTFIKTRKFNRDHFKLIFLSVLELNQIKFIIDSFENISIFNNTIVGTIRKIVNFKEKMFEELKKHYNSFLDENPIFLEKFKVLKTKKVILDTIQEEQFQEIYEKLIKIVIF